MSPVGGSRHYDGAGLGDTLTWRCPGCGADNTGPIAQGCLLCGAGTPGQRVSERPPDDPTYHQPPAAAVRQGDIADHWASRHPDATIADAYRAGLIEGMRAARAAADRGQPTDPESHTADAKITRTIIAALALFRDQVLADSPEEIATGEWLSVEESNLLIARLQREVPEVTHA